MVSSLQQDQQWGQEKEVESPWSLAAHLPLVSYYNYFSHCLRNGFTTWHSCYQAAWLHSSLWCIFKRDINTMRSIRFVFTVTQRWKVNCQYTPCGVMQSLKMMNNLSAWDCHFTFRGNIKLLGSNQYFDERLCFIYFLCIFID